MKRFPQAIFFLIATLFALSAYGQEPQAVQNSQTERPVDRIGILRELGLSPDQIRQMRVINRDIRAKRQAARLRVKEATRSLDQAVYADAVDEALVSQRLRDLQDAQSEIIKINFENEFAIRKVLNPEQLVRFREIRKKFNDDRKNFPRRRQNRRQNRNVQPPADDLQRGQPATDRHPAKAIRRQKPGSS